MEPHDPLSLFHTQSLSFSLDDLGTLSSAQLALVQFHPEASELQQERAKLLFVQRRRAWLDEQEGAGAVKREVVEEGDAKQEEAPVKQEEREEDVKPVVKVEREEVPAEMVKVKREVEEISLLDDDDDEVVITKGGGEGKREAERLTAKKRKSDPTAASSSSSLTVRPALPKKRKSDPGEASSTTRAIKAPRRVLPPPLPAPPAEPAPVTSAPPAPPAPTVTASGTNKLLKLPSFRRNTSDPQPPPPIEEEEPLPFSLPGLKPPPRPTPPPAPAPVAAEPVAPLPTVNIDILYRRTTFPHSPPRTLSPPPLPRPVFVPNRATRARERMHSWLPDWVVESFSQEEGDRDPHFIYRPPPPDPEWHPVPADSLRATDDIAPEELRKQLVTVKVSGLGEELTPELLFRFLVRGKRLHPRPLAIRRLDEVEDGCFIVEGGEQIDHEARPFLVAFKSLEDAQRAIDYSINKQLPNVPSGCCNWLTLSFAAPWPPPPPKPAPPFDPSSSTATTAEPAVPPTLTPHERHLQLIKASDAELALGWKWGELSEEVRTAWLTRRRLPSSKRCPPRDIRSEGDDWNISEEYDEELERIFNSTDPLVRMKASLRVEIAKEKKVIYKERCDAYNKWADKVDPKNVDPNDPSKPEIPTYPFDSVALERIEARRKVEREMVVRHVKESMAQLRDTFASSAQDERERLRRQVEEETRRKRREEKRDPNAEMVRSLVQQVAAVLKEPEEEKEEQEAKPVQAEKGEGASVVADMTAAEQRQKRREYLAGVSLSSLGFTINPSISKYGAGSAAPTASTSTDTTTASATVRAARSAGSANLPKAQDPSAVSSSTVDHASSLVGAKATERRKSPGINLLSILGGNAQSSRSASSAPPPGPSAARIAHLSSLDKVDIPGLLRSTAAPSPAPPVTP